MQDIQRVITRYYDTLFQSSNPSSHVIDETLCTVAPIVSSEMNATLLLPFTPEEVRCALDQMYPYKSPGPDVGHFRPISLCNVIYKISSKTIANRLKPLLPAIISKTQSAFIPGQLISDNVLIAYETNHFLAHKYRGKEGHVALKLDISKAYDRVEWLFLERALEVFSRMIQHEEVSGTLNYVTVSRDGPRISHLLFADDTLLFMQATEEVLLCVERMLRQFEATSGLAINWQKSAAVCSRNVDKASREALGQVLGFTVVDKHEKYLGLPTVIGRSKRAVFEHLKSRIWNKMQHWRTKLLSTGRADGPP
ncbi:UNVERIFIED_CONTAM: hypothetical protein Slati_2382600 [Sesamum latifolium]|uniref:Reverse transcriptase domain-containing protein n=1 Tax=Sesamum latifolium TaxID=2727402 RepID=A0AAW2WCI2_9LAMI